ncbi:hypothetical protein SUNI508_08993 [Seiridium unicorne]|uniref:Uncharacterized protein n=1 Tax=Seiridium unicorne TaxID=138068 RepID=A0ABR2URP8_9PEZI
MQFFTIAAAALLASTGLAAPSVNARTLQVQVEFQGAAGVAQTQWVPADGATHAAEADFSVSHIAVLDPVPASVNCYAYGIDGSETFTYGPGTVDVGPPQVQTIISCTIGPR